MADSHPSRLHQRQGESDRVLYVVLGLPLSVMGFVADWIIAGS
jgi:hypothetical protein